MVCLSLHNLSFVSLTFPFVHLLVYMWKRRDLLNFMTSQINLPLVPAMVTLGLKSTLADCTIELMLLEFAVVPRKSASLNWY